MIGRTLGILIRALVERRTWGALFRLMLFPRMALRSAKHGGKARVGSTRDHCNAGCVAAVTLPIDYLLRLAASPVEGARTRRRAAAEAGVRTNDPRTLEAVRAFLAEGAPARAVALLSSSGLHDGDDPATIAALRALHPEGVCSSAPCREEWAAPATWATDEVESMR